MIGLAAEGLMRHTRKKGAVHAIKWAVQRARCITLEKSVCSWSACQPWRAYQPGPPG
ncbi:hypothetical protein MPLDJ20_220011 [Mesorhizobium plurifarium]|uniref:Uncharacterized protein n=1 Tax=Mesorhizobium plurifarium TaxID=69974 RepID=A0A090GLY6_MESPL|nr:hypothetical protein MPLDJ20_220011 [Mesorhizobium plurifarium]